MRYDVGKKEKKERWITIWEYVERFRPGKLAWFLFSMGLCISVGILLPKGDEHWLLGLVVGAAFGIALWACGEGQFDANTREIADMVINGPVESVLHPSRWRYLPQDQITMVRLPAKDGFPACRFGVAKPGPDVRWARHTALYYALKWLDEDWWTSFMYYRRN